MATKSALPDYKEKQKLLYAPQPDPARLSEVGEKFFAAGLLYDAIEFFARAGKKEKLEEIKQSVVQQGDAFLLRKLLKTTGEEATADLWQRLGEEARRLGKLEYAYEAFRLSGDKKALDEVYNQLRPQAPVESFTAEPEKDVQK